VAPGVRVNWVAAYVGVNRGGDVERSSGGGGKCDLDETGGARPPARGKRTPRGKCTRLGKEAKNTRPNTKIAKKSRQEGGGNLPTFGGGGVGAGDKQGPSRGECGR